MAISERTYTFRAPADLGDRIKETGRRLGELSAEPGTDLADRIAREMARMIARRGGVGGTALVGDNQSAFLREMVEIVVKAAEKVASDDAWTKVYKEWYDNRTPEQIADDDARQAWMDAASAELHRSGQPE